MLFYRINLCEVLYDDPTFTPTRLLNLIRQLPEGSQYMADVQDLPDSRDWGVSEWLLAGVINAVNLNTRATGFWAKGKAPDFPIVKGPTPPEKPKQQSLRDFYAALAAGAPQ